MLIADKLRTTYVHAPAWVRSVASPILALAPERYRFGGAYEEYRKHISHAREDYKFVQVWRRDKLRSLLRAAYEGAPYYRKLFNGKGIDLKQIGAFQVEDLINLPVLKKEQLRLSLNDFLTVSPSSLDAVSTSGSTGTPLLFYLDKDRSPKEWAFVLDSWGKIGFLVPKGRAVFRGLFLPNVDKKPWQYEPALRELRLSPFHLVDTWMNEYCSLILRYKVRFLHGYPSALSIFANYVLRAKRNDIVQQIEGVIAASEALLPHQRDMISKAFHTDKIISFYGMSEKVAFGSDDPVFPGIFEMNPIYGIVELIDENDRPVTKPGLRGRIICTGLLFRGMPFVRYDTGDTAELVDAASPDNCFHLRLRDISSRWGQEYLVGRDNQLISMTAINIHSPAYTKMSAFQFFQDTPGEAVLKVVMAPGCVIEDVTPFIAEISKKIGSSIKFTVEAVESLPVNTRGKSKFIDQRIYLYANGNGRPEEN